VTGRLVTEEQLRERLRGAGKSKAEIEDLIDEYADASSSDFPDEDAISRILQKTQEDSVLRVKSFKLTRAQYDALLGHYMEARAAVAEEQVDAGLLVREALEDFIDLVS
jgi:hypothetical protein